MTNKELAVHLYCAILQANATIASNPNCKSPIAQMPEPENAVDAVKELALLLSSIEDK